MKVYCLDSNVFIHAWNDYYAPDQCPEYWEILDGLAKQGRIFCCDEVRREIEKQDDGLCRWLKARPHFVQDISTDVQRNVREILQKYPLLVNSKKDRSMADPWVVAHAMACGAVVVTKEMPGGGNGKAPKIPDVCDGVKVAWINDFLFNRELKIRFRAHRDEGNAS
jgi:hypothetical protein